MKHFKLITLIILSMTLSFNSQAKRLLWPVLSDESDQVIIVGEMQSNVYPDIQLFPALNNPAIYSNNEDSLLFEYYSSAIKGDVNKMASLFLESDGSRERFNKKLAKNPQKYSGYAQLELVKVLYKTNWGKYILVGVELSGNGKKMHWFETLDCNGEQCFLTDFQYRIDENQQVFRGSHSGFLEKLLSEKEGNLRDKATKSGLINKSNSVVILPSGSLDSKSKLVPLVLYTKLKANDQIVPIVAKIKSSKEEKNIAISFIADLQQLSLNRDEGLSHPELAKVMSKYWDGYSKERSIPIFGINNDNKTKNLLLSKRESYTQFAFYELVSKWEGIKIQAEIKTSKYIYMFYRPIEGGQEGHLQVFVFLNNKSKTPMLSFNASYSSDSDIVLSSHVMSLYNKQLKKNE